MKKLILLLLLASTVGINIFFRMSTATLSFTREIAKNYVLNKLVKEAQKEIEDRFKDLPAETRLKSAEALVDIWKVEKKKYISDAERQKEKELKSDWQDGTGHTFLLEIDSYHWFRLVNNLVSHGKIGDQIINNVEYDSFMLAPVGMKVETSYHRNFHVYLSYYIFKIIKIFVKNINLMHFVFYMPVIMSCLALVLVFFLCLTISRKKNNISGFFAAVSLGLSRVFLFRSQGGWFDTDAYVVLFSVLSVWTFYLSLNYESSFKKRSLFTVISGLSIGLFSFTWEGWWYIFDLIIVSALIYILNIFLIKKSGEEEGIKLGPLFLLLSLFILSSAIFVGLFSGLAILGRFLSEPIKIAFAKGYLQHQFWPNTFLTVQELRTANFIDVINQIGGWYVFFLSLAYLFVSLNDKKSREYLSRQFIIFLFTIWIFVMSLVSLKALRFSLLLLVPVSISFGLFMEWMFYFLSDRIIRILKISQIKLKLTLFFIFCLFFAGLYLDKALALRKNIPIINKNWWEVLNRIKIETPQEAIVNSWWDYGHWFKAIAERRVIFDGITQNKPMAYWMGRVFLTNSEQDAFGILRMLNSGGNTAFEELEKLGIDKYRCLDILNEIILLGRKDAFVALAKYISNPDERERILKYTHNPRIAYFVVEPSLLYKSRSITFLGGWNFKKANIYQKFKEFKKEDFVGYLIKEYKYNPNDAMKLYGTLTFLNTEDALSWISPGYKYNQESKNFRKEGNLLFFDNGYVVDLSNHNVYYNDLREAKWKVPKSIYYIENDTIKEVNFKNSDLSSSVLLVQEKDNYKILGLDSRLVGSMLTRLYYLRGIGLKNFKPFITKEFKDNEAHIIVYKIEWSGVE